MNALPLHCGHLAAASTILIAMLIGPTPGHADTPTWLYHCFDTPPTGQWAERSLPVQPGAWRLGAEDGPTATSKHLRAVLSEARGLAIGARYQGSSHDRTRDPREVELAQPAWPPSRAAPESDAAEWMTNTGGTLVHFEQGSVAAASWGGKDVGQTSPLAAGRHQDLFCLVAPASSLARPFLRDTSGLHFRLRLSHSPLARPISAARPEGCATRHLDPRSLQRAAVWEANRSAR